MLGRTLLERESFPEALDTFKKAVNLAPDSSEALEGLIKAQIALELKDKALTTLKRALMVDQKNPAFHVTLVDLLIEEGQVDEAIAHLKKAIGNDPAQPLLRRKMEELTRRLPVLRKRATSANLVEKNSPFEIEVYDILDDLYDNKITLEAAIKAMRNLRDKDPLDLFIADELANLHFQARSYEEAFDLYSQIQKSAPRESRHRINLAKSLALSGNLPLAREFLGESIRELPGEIELPLALVELHLLALEYAPAAAVLNKVLAQDPDNVHGLFLQGFIALQTGELATATESLRKVLTQVPDDEEAAVWYSRLMILQNHPEGAVEVWNSFQDGIESLQEIIVRVELALAAGHLDQARELLKRIGSFEPHFVEDELLFAKACFYAGDFPVAAERLERVLARDTGHAEALAMMAMIHLFKNKGAKFWMYWQKAVERDSLPPVLLGLVVRKALNFTQNERLKTETQKLLDLSVRNPVDRGRLAAFVRAL